MAASPQSPDNLAQYRYLTGTNFETGITAAAGGTQAAAYALSAQMSRIDTVGTTSDSVAVPEIQAFASGDARLAGIGVMMFIFNNGANNAQVFGTNTDTINGVAAATGVALPAGKGMILWAVNFNATTGVGQWNAIISA